jgi:hypothetical protein
MAPLPSSLAGFPRRFTHPSAPDFIVSFTEVALKSPNPTFVDGFSSSPDFAAAEKLARQQSLIPYVELHM